VVAVRANVIRDRSSMSGSRVRALVIDAAYRCEIATEADWQSTEWRFEHLDRPLVRPGARRPFPDDPRLVVFDFDGVMPATRGWVAEDGGESVACSRSDGLGLDALRRLDLDLFVLSTEVNPVVAARCRKLGVSFAQGVGDKGDYLRRMLSE